MEKLYSRLGWFTAGIITGVVGVFVYQVFGKPVEPKLPPGYEWLDLLDRFDEWDNQKRFVEVMVGSQFFKPDYPPFSDYRDASAKTQPIYTGGE